MQGLEVRNGPLAAGRWQHCHQPDRAGASYNTVNRILGFMGSWLLDTSSSMITQVLCHAGY